MASNAEVTAVEIARLAGVGRAAVSNWRRRHGDFPEPAGGTRVSPTFKLDEVERWLIANGRLHPTGVGQAAGASVSPTGAIDSPMVRCLVALLPPLGSGVIVDPACVDGAVLAAAAERFGGDLTYVAECFGVTDAAIVERALVGERRSVHVVEGDPFDDALADYLARADAVISVPPGGHVAVLDDVFHDRWEFGPPAKGDIALAWVQTAYSFLRPGGVAALVVPFVAATRASGRRIRSELLRAGVLTHVIALPDVAGGSPSQIWLLRRPTGRPGYTLRMVDLTSCDASVLPREHADWFAVFDDQELTRDVPSIELLDEDVLLVPSAHIAKSPRDVGPEYGALTVDYAALVRGLGKERPPAFAPVEPVDLPTVGVADLQRVGALEIRDRQDVEPGDVLVPSGPDRFDGVTVATRCEEVQRGVVVIRCDAGQIDPFFLACFLRSEANRRQAVGTQSGSFRLDLRRARVPRIPLAEQRRYGTAFRQLVDFATRADEVAGAAHEIVRTAVYGLTSGVLATSTGSGDSDDHGA
jgi:hypothetical protein